MKTSKRITVGILAFVVLSFSVLAGSGCDGGGGSEEAVCTAQEKECDGNDVVKCNAAGTDWDLYKECPNGCEAGACKADETCTPACDGKSCGPDGCGGQCGACTGGQSCDAAGKCTDTVCQPSCDGKKCGDDSCGGVCGLCDAGESCVQGSCQEGPCVPACGGKACGDDGCGGSCGNCAAGTECINNKCESTQSCTPGDIGCSLAGDVVKCNTAGTDWDLVEVCPEGCNLGECVEICYPDCGGKECGDDGCGGGCGTCPDGVICIDGECPTVYGISHYVQFYNASVTETNSNDDYNTWDALGGMPDPYVVLSVNGEAVCTSFTDDDTVSPIWKDGCDYVFWPFDEVEFTVWDEDSSSDDWMGGVVVSTEGLKAALTEGILYWGPDDPSYGLQEITIHFL